MSPSIVPRRPHRVHLADSIGAGLVVMLLGGCCQADFKETPSRHVKFQDEVGVVMVSPQPVRTWSSMAGELQQISYGLTPANALTTVFPDVAQDSSRRTAIDKLSLGVGFPTSKSTSSEQTTVTTKDDQTDTVRRPRSRMTGAPAPRPTRRRPAARMPSAPCAP